MRLCGRRVIIREMRQEDVDAMMRWRPSADPIYQPFDFPKRSQAEHYAWFTDRARDPARRLCTIEGPSGQVIGSLTLREMNNGQSARLGITLGADFLSQGLGTEALRLFLDHYFGSMGFSRLNLDVATTNLRAIRCYRRLGFKETGRHWEAAIHPSYRVLALGAQYQHFRSCFKRQGTAIEVQFIDMALTNSDWQESSAKPGTSSRHPQCPAA
jgi:RimJ/RimL family protein N-acetyltransferase